VTETPKTSMNQIYKILLLEDDEILGQTLEEYFFQKKYSCHWVKSIKQADELLKDNIFHLLLLDLNLPDGKSINIAKRILQQDEFKNDPTPIIFISAQADPEARLSILEMGAYDVIHKPFTLKELLIKIERVLSGSHFLKKLQQTYQYGSLSIHFSRYQVIDGQGNTHHLNHKECSILKLLHDQLDLVVTRDKIIEEIWGEEAFPSTRTVDNYIVNLRKWCETDQTKSLQIHSIRGVGYKLTYIKP